ncbi:MAG: hypothetical protein ACPGMR_03230 [Pontibacterium sp.]
MNKYSVISARRLSECHSELQLLFRVVLKRYDHSVYCGHRDEATQNEAYENKDSKLRWPDSKHNSIPSKAIDAGPYFSDVDRWDEDQCRHFGGYVMGVADMLFEQGLMTYRVRWGGDWDQDKNIKDQTFNDLVHFELVEA